eukprot:12182827-Alexandrium_andersonii.AAC.1
MALLGCRPMCAVGTLHGRISPAACVHLSHHLPSEAMAFAIIPYVIVATVPVSAVGSGGCA